MYSAPMSRKESRSVPSRDCTWEEYPLDTTAARDHSGKRGSPCEPQHPGGVHPNPREAEAVRELFRRYASGTATLSQLAEWLNDHIENWKFKIEDTAPGTMVRLRKNNERVVALNIHDQFIKVGDKFRSLTEEERTALDRIIKKDE